MKAPKPGESFIPYRRFVGAMVPTPILVNPDITANSKLVLARLIQFAGENGKAWPRVEVLGAEVGLKIRHARRCLQELEEKGLIRRVKGGGRHKSNQIDFIWGPLWTTGNPVRYDRVSGGENPVTDNSLSARETRSDTTAFSPLNPVMEDRISDTETRSYKVGNPVTECPKPGQIRPPEENHEEIQEENQQQQHKRHSEDSTGTEGNSAAVDAPIFHDEKPPISAEIRKRICAESNVLVEWASPLTPNNPLVDRMWELAASLGATPELLVRFLGMQRPTARWRSHGIILSLISNDLPGFIAEPPPEPEPVYIPCKRCSDTGFVGHTAGSWYVEQYTKPLVLCECAAGIQRANEATPVYSVADGLCSSCLSNLRWQSRRDENEGKKPQCAFCRRNEVKHWFGHPEFEKPAAVAERLGAITEAPPCDACFDPLRRFSTGIVHERWETAEASARFCDCRWGSATRDTTSTEALERDAANQRAWMETCSRFPGTPGRLRTA